MDGTLSMRCQHPFVRDGCLAFPCGRCVECRVRRSEQVARRLELELMACEDATSDYSSFVTLTYAPEFLPAGGSLQGRDCRLYELRLRSAVARAGGPRFRIARCGEYGDRFGRPHFHLMLLGLNPLVWGDAIRDAWSLGGVHVLVASAQRCRYMVQDMAKWLRKGDLRLEGREAPFFRGPRGHAGGMGTALARKVGQAQAATPALRRVLAAKGDVQPAVRIGARVVSFDRTMLRHARSAAGLDPEACAARVARDYRKRCELSEAVKGRNVFRHTLTDAYGNLVRVTRRKIFAKGSSL